MIRANARLTRRIAVAIMGLLLLPWGLAHAQQPPVPAAHLTGRAAVDALVGNTMTGTSDGAPYFAYYDKGGEVRMKSGSDVQTGHWAADGDSLCEEYPDDEDETCYKLDLDGAQGVMTDEDGTSYAITIVLGNPEKLLVAACEATVNHDNYPDIYIKNILTTTKTLALVGASANPARPSYIVLKYLSERGYKVIPVNPGLAGQKILGMEVVASLKDIREPLDMVEIFRNSQAAGPIVDEALSLDPLPKVIWMQLSVRNDEAAARAEAKGVRVVMNRCPKIEYGRLSGEIGWQGINSRIISSKKQVMSAKGFQKRTLGV